MNYKNAVSWVGGFLGVFLCVFTLIFTTLNLFLDKKLTIVIESPIVVETYSGENSHEKYIKINNTILSFPETFREVHLKGNKIQLSSYSIKFLEFENADIAKMTFDMILEEMDCLLVGCGGE